MLTSKLEKKNYNDLTSLMNNNLIFIKTYCFSYILNKITDFIIGLRQEAIVFNTKCKTYNKITKYQTQNNKR